MTADIRAERTRVHVLAVLRREVSTLVALRDSVDPLDFIEIHDVLNYLLSHVDQAIPGIEKGEVIL